MSDFWKDKKIIVYIALAHHTRFISPVARQMSKQGAKVIYVVGQAERSQEITAINLGLNYIHVFDCLGDEDQEEIQTNYLRLRDTFTESLNTGFLFSGTPVTVIDKTIYSTAMEYIGFRNLIRDEKPDLCFALHELNRWGKMFSFWAKKHHVPVLTFQEGLYYGMDYGYTGHAQYSTLNLVWGNRVRHKLIDFEAPADRIIEVGNTHLANEIAHQKKHNIREKKRAELNCADAQVILLLFSGEIPNPKEFLPVFKAISTLGNRRVFIKFHPASKHDQIQKWISCIPLEDKDSIQTFCGDENLYDLLSASDVCALVQASTTGLEALFFDKPLIQLEVPMKSRLPYSFTEMGVVAQMTPPRFVKALNENMDFNRLMDKEKIRHYLDTELSDTSNAISNVMDIAQNIITAIRTPEPKPLNALKEIDKVWSIILKPASDPDLLLGQLEAIAVHSENSGEFEVILIEPEILPQKVSKVLDSLKGNLLRLKTDPGQTLPSMMNRAAMAASGKNLVFLSGCLVPQPEWLAHLKTGMKRHGGNSILGARIWDRRGGLCHAGILIDQNNSPVPAFVHMPQNFPPALNERPFQLLDRLLCMSRSFFLNAGGFQAKAGAYAFMEFCLRTAIPETGHCFYLPQVCLMLMDDEADHKTRDRSPGDATWFYGRWQGVLWQNDDAFYNQEQVSKVTLDTQRLTHSMAATL